VTYLARPSTTGTELRSTVAAVVDEQGVELVAARFLVDEGLAGSIDEGREAATRAAGTAPDVEVDVGTAGSDRAIGFDQGAAQQLILFMFVTSLSASSMLIETRRFGVSRRMLASPTRASTVLLGEALGRFAIALLQGALIVVGTALLFIATQFVYAATGAAGIALLATAAGGAGFVACEVVGETTLARVVPQDVLGRVLGVMAGVSVAALLAGAVVAPLLIGATSLATSLLVLGTVAVAVVLASRVALAGLDALSRERAEALASRIAVIERLPVVAGAPRPALEELAGASQVIPLPAGVDVVVVGAPAHAFYAIVDGRVVVHHDDRAIAELKAGDHFGERGLLDEAPRNATVTTQEESRLLRIEGDVFLDALQAVPSLRADLARATSGRRGAAASALVDDPVWAQA
jgi:hypothetical protein